MADKPEAKIYQDTKKETHSVSKQSPSRPEKSGKGSRQMVWTLLGVALLVVLVIIIFTNIARNF